MRLMRRASAAWTVAALALLNAALSFHDAWPTPWITLRPELSVEAAAVVLALCLALSRGRQPSPRALTALALLLTVLCVGRYVQVIAPALHGRPINLYWDGPHIPRVAAMLIEAVPAWVSAAALATGALLLALLFLCLRIAVAGVVQGLAANTPRRVVAGACAALLLAWVAGMAGIAPPGLAGTGDTAGAGAAGTPGAVYRDTAAGGLAGTPGTVYRETAAGGAVDAPGAGARDMAGAGLAGTPGTVHRDTAADGATGTAGAGSGGWFSVPVLYALGEQAALAYAALRERSAAAPPDAAPLPASRLDAVRGADVLLVFVESYGAATFDRAPVAARVTPRRDALARAAAHTGRGMVSAFVTSPTFGGASWLAHASLMAGTPIVDAPGYARLLAGSRETLVTRFAAAGYRTVALMPGLKRPWPEGNFYGFDRLYREPDLAYRGPAFGWWRIPDQFSLARLDASELASRDRAPVFAFFPTVSSHLPFRPTPPYRDEWPAMLGAEPYTAPEVAASLARMPDWMDLAPSYAGAVAYGLTTLAGYLEWRRDRDLVLVVLGDHQPAAIVSGPGARWDVPVHVISTRREVLAALRAAGFVDGASPRPRPLMPLHRLAAVLLDAFQRAAASPDPMAARAPGSTARKGSRAASLAGKDPRARVRLPGTGARSQ